ncbi:MAG: hypothetical protein DMD67_00345 [Gemmatimonadetes bacterium]|nr:MAG: hypothetical protein DMD67_00345 [Gemmatimonadota bacterium]
MPRIIFWDVDTQYDFMHADGKLYVPEAERIVGNLKRLTDYAHAHGIRIVASADDHVTAHPEISDAPDWATTFPPHCMRGTPGQKKIPETGLRDPLVMPMPRHLVNGCGHTRGTSSFTSTGSTCLPTRTSGWSSTCSHRMISSCTAWRRTCVTRPRSKAYLSDGRAPDSSS